MVQLGYLKTIPERKCLFCRWFCSRVLVGVHNLCSPYRCFDCNNVNHHSQTGCFLLGVLTSNNSPVRTKALYVNVRSPLIIRNAFSCRSYLWRSWRPSGYIHYYKSPLLFKLPRGAQQLPPNPISTSFDILAMAADNTDQMFWSREFARLVGVLTNAHLVSAAEHGEIWGHIFDWKSSLAALI